MIYLFDFYIRSLSELLQAGSAVITIIGVIAILYNIRSYRLSQHQFRHGVMTHCLDRYWEITFEKKDLKESNPKDWLALYMELVNEEMFYFQVGYLPTEVMVEWLDGILDNVVISEAKNVIPIHKPSVGGEGLAKEKQDTFPRLRKAFTVKTGNDYSSAFKNEEANLNPGVRKDLIIEVIENLRGQLSKRLRKEIREMNLIYDNTY